MLRIWIQIIEEQFIIESSVEDPDWQIIEEQGIFDSSVEDQDSVN